MYRPRFMPGRRADVLEVPGESRERNLAYTLVPAHAAGGTASGVIVYATDEADEREQEANSDVQRDVTLS